MNLKHSQVELIQIIARLLPYRGRELLLLLRKISLRTGQPSGDNVECRLIAISGGHAIQRLSGEIDLPKAQSR